MNAENRYLKFQKYLNFYDHNCLKLQSQLKIRNCFPHFLAASSKPVIHGTKPDMLSALSSPFLEVWVCVCMLVSVYWAVKK